MPASMSAVPIRSPQLPSADLGCELVHCVNDVRPHQIELIRQRGVSQFVESLSGVLRPRPNPSLLNCGTKETTNSPYHIYYVVELLTPTAVADKHLT